MTAYCRRKVYALPEEAKAETVNKFNTMEKYLVAVEFRYAGEPDYTGSAYYAKSLTIGVFESFDDAIEHGNKFLEYMETLFPLSGQKDRFGKTNGPFRSKTTLVSNLGYLKTPFEFYAKITTLNFDDQGKFVASILSEIK